MLSGNRRLHVSTRLLLASVNDNSSRKSVEKKLTDELLSLIKGTKSKTYLKKVENEKIALKNKSNAHYRW
jgi:ribosomal protein S7